MSLEASTVKTKKGHIEIKVYKGHFATSHSHINYYIDVCAQKAKAQNAKEVARTLAAHYKGSAIIDTILCLDGMEVIGAFMAEELCKADYASLNAGKNIAVLTPEYTAGSQLFFRDNIAPMVMGQHVLVLVGSLVTGYTSKSACEAIQYYGGVVSGIAAIFATATESQGLPVVSVFNPEDLPDYNSYTPLECPMCKAGWKVEALLNSHGLSKL